MSQATRSPPSTRSTLFYRPDPSYTSADEGVHYIPVPASGEIILHTLTRQQKRLLRNMGKSSPPPRDEIPIMQSARPSPHSPGRHGLRKPHQVISSEDTIDPAYAVTQRVHDSMERVTIQKARLAAMRAGSPSGSESSDPSPTTPQREWCGSSPLAVEVEACAPGEGIPSLAELEAAPWVPANYAEDGSWEPLFAAEVTEGGTSLNGLGISVWTPGTAVCWGPPGETAPEAESSPTTTEFQDLYPAADDGSRTVRMPPRPESDTTSDKGTIAVPILPIEVGGPGLGFGLLGTGFRGTGPVSTAVLRLSWGWRSAPEGGETYLKRGIEGARGCLKDGSPL